MGEHVGLDVGLDVGEHVGLAQLGELAGVNVPNQAAEHYYLITGPMPEVNPDWPVVESPSDYTYIRPEGGGLMVGLFEPEAAAWAVDKVRHGTRHLPRHCHGH